VPLCDLNVEKILEDSEVFNNENKKNEWVEAIETSMDWQQEHFK
jgi:hypothetical protein